MGNRDRGKKDVKRLQLRREVIRILAGDSLSRVQGGGLPIPGTRRCVLDTQCGASDSLCQPSKETLGP